MNMDPKIHNKILTDQIQQHIKKGLQILTKYSLPQKWKACLTFKYQFI